MIGEICVLGCGSSAGTPVIACDCAVCQSDQPKNRRTRCSAWLQISGRHFLIDTSPDLRAQALREGMTQVDAVLYTHPHADHLNGLDDLRAFCYQQRAAIPVYGNSFLINNIRERFSYACHAPTAHWDKPNLLLNVAHAPFYIDDILITPIPVEHGAWSILGWRLGGLAWLTDVSVVPESSLPLLQNLELLFLDCLREAPYSSHLGVEQAFALAKQIGAKHTVLIHMTHQLDFAALSARCPEGVSVAWDGLRLPFTC